MDSKGAPWFVTTVSCVSVIILSNTFCCTESTDRKDVKEDNSNMAQGSGGTDIHIPGEGGSTASAGSGGTQTETSVAEVVECSGSYDFGVIGPLFTSYGRCIKLTDECIGGRVDQVDWSAIILANVQGFEREDLGVIELPIVQTGCDEGFVCCINTDECESVYDQIKSNPIVSPWAPGLLITCTSPDLCNSSNGTPLQVGCPQGEVCCVGIEPGYTR